MSIIDGTIFNSYHLGEDAAEKSMDKYVERDWIYNRIIVNNTCLLYTSDPIFINYGFNKVEFIMELRQSGRKKEMI